MTTNIREPTTLKDLPIDILLNILDYLDSNSQLQTGLASKFISRASIQKLWHRITCTTPLKLELMISTLLNQQGTMYPYRDLLMRLDIAFRPQQQQSVSSMTTWSKSNKMVQIKALQLVNVHHGTSQNIFQLFISNKIREIDLKNCSGSRDLSSHVDQFQNLNRLCIQDCPHVTDLWVSQIVSSTPQLRHFSCRRSGYMSDIAILAITQHCPLIETIIATLPCHIIQSNTITFTSLQALARCCVVLKKFVCRGQVRIANLESRDWLYQHCKNLEYCDLSI